jgi:hypothetical protein
VPQSRVTQTGNTGGGGGGGFGDNNPGPAYIPYRIGGAGGAGVVIVEY